MPEYFVFLPTHEIFHILLRDKIKDLRGCFTSINA